MLPVAISSRASFSCLLIIRLFSSSTSRWGKKHARGICWVLNGWSVSGSVSLGSAPSSWLRRAHRFSGSRSIWQVKYCSRPSRDSIGSPSGTTGAGGYINAWRNWSRIRMRPLTGSSGGGGGNSRVPMRWLSGNDRNQFVSQALSSCRSAGEVVLIIDIIDSGNCSAE